MQLAMPSNSRANVTTRSAMGAIVNMLSLCLMVGCNNPRPMPQDTVKVPSDAGADAVRDAESGLGSIGDRPTNTECLSPDLGGTHCAGGNIPPVIDARDAGRPVIRDAGQNVTDEDAGCLPPEKPIHFDAATKCSPELCPAQDSICIPDTTLALLVPRASIELLAKCSDTYRCVPLSIASQAGRAVLTRCRSVNDAEGRCVSSCVPQVATQSNILPKDICTGGDLCAPCYDPRTGEDTLACRQGCDGGPREPAKPFATCCSERGLCVPPVLAGSQAGNLNQDGCAGDNLCSPRELTESTFRPAGCDSVDGVEGRCLSTCIGGALSKQLSRLPTLGCGQSEVCAPCFDPITGEQTGACGIHGDVPAKPKRVFDRCCGTDVGVCVPPEVAGKQADLLNQDSCARGKLCAPIVKAMDPSYRFPMCPDGTDGACVPSCTLNTFIGTILTSGACQADSVCAPCSVFGRQTGACE